MDPQSTLSDVTRASLLIRLSQDGPEREVAWVEFHDLYAPVIAGFARRMGAKSQEVDDLVQEVLKAFFASARSLSTVPRQGGSAAISRRASGASWQPSAASTARKRKASIQTTFPTPAMSRSNPSGTMSGRPRNWAGALAVVRQRYATNAERQRTFRAFEMCTLLDRPVEQVAAELGLSLESVRAAKSRVSKALREAFDRLDEIPG